MKNQLLILGLLVFSCDTTGRSSVSSNVVYEKYTLDCSVEGDYVQIDMSNYPVVSFYQVGSGFPIPMDWENARSLYIGDGSSTIYEFACSSIHDKQYVFSVVRPA